MPAFHTMCKKIPLHKIRSFLYILFSHAINVHTQEIQSATTKRGKREVRSEYFFVGIIFKKLFKIATPRTGPSQTLPEFTQGDDEPPKPLLKNSTWEKSHSPGHWYQTLVITRERQSHGRNIQGF